MTTALLQLELDKFRGASVPLTINFDKGRPSVLIFGENGTGKSTIVDAIDFVANKHHGSLEHRSLDGLSKVESLRCIGSTAADVSVRLTTAAGTWTGGIDKKQITRTGPAEAPVVRVLRRPGLNRLMEAQPQQRYEVLQRFVGAEAIERSEAALDKLAKGWESESASAVTNISRTTEQLRPIAESAGASSEDPIGWARGELDQQVADVEKDVESISCLIASLDKLRLASSQLATAKEQQAKSSGARLAAEQAVRDLEGEQDGASDLIDVLQKARDYVGKRPEPACPVCTQGVNPTELLNLLDERLFAAKNLADLTHERAKCVRAEVAANQTVETQTSAFTQSMAAVQEVESEAVVINAVKSLCVPKDEEPDLGEIESQCQVVVDALNAGREAKRAVIARRKTLEVLVRQYDDAVAAYSVSNKLAVRARKLHDLVKAKRHDYSQTILDSISDEADRLYEMIHPGEGLGGSKLSMVRRNSIEQKAKFAGQEVVPGAFYSESHLDTLGFCVWVAIAKLESPENTVVVLDDVFTSVDLEHLRRITNVIGDMVDSFAQVIIVTHSRRWHDYYRLNQGGSPTIELRELFRPHGALGIQIAGTTLPVGHLAQKLQEQPLDRQSVASMAGILLEAMLDRLCFLYGISLPRNAVNRWTLGHYLSAMSSKHVKKLAFERVCPEGKTDCKVKTPYESIGPLYEEQGLLGLVRNQVGAHFNLDGADIPNADVVAFAASVLDLSASLSCPWCGGIPEKRDTDAYRCGCKATRLKPLSL